MLTIFYYLYPYYDYLLDKVKSTDIRQCLNIEPLLLRIKRSQLRWYGHVTRMFHERTAKQLIDALPSAKSLDYVDIYATQNSRAELC